MNRLEKLCDERNVCIGWTEKIGQLTLLGDSDATDFVTPYTHMGDWYGEDVDPARVVAACLGELGYWADEWAAGRPTGHIGNVPVDSYVRGLRGVLGELGPYLEAMEADFPLGVETDYRALSVGLDPMSADFQLWAMPLDWDELYARLFDKDPA